MHLNECVYTESGEIRHVIPEKAFRRKISEFLEEKLARSINLPSFEDAIIYANRIASLARKYNYYSDIHIWKKR
uniref:Uncharacterized protein n=1 Tax=Candidatus Kentrum sp. TC TaxID=2126339 RepID=A0A450Z0F1_9GAMM|nr:MAG: hypothetical protein BECKTC1821E_GA0114239_10799 [Candidatus Kentron sp. TC]VFK51940.1 MAG: hypothetical protein BECKTC1821D_GA0114238_11474 [Candidatus Kentron sp. TC]VFK62582.1 MAG: hypothetical protein BECKTC1821F_GA0114240_107611 [Candidatus Kentron sp. TC]